MSGKSTSTMFDQAFSSLAGQAAYNPSKYAEHCEEEEAWGDLDSEVYYHEEFLKKEPRQPPALQITPQPAQVQPSKVVQKYFKVARAEPPTKPVEPPVNTANLQVEQKIEELNQEVARFKRESDQLKQVSILCENQGRKLAKEQQEHMKIISEAKSVFQATIEAEMDEFKKKLRVRERNQRALSGMPSKKEREERDLLKASIQKVQEEMKARDTRFKLNKERMAKQIYEASVRKHELLDQVNALKKAVQPEESEREGLMIQSLSASSVDPQTETQECANIGAPERIQEAVVPHDYIEPPEYTEPVSVVTQQTYPDGTVVKLFATQHKEILYPSGTKHEVYPNGYSVVFHTNSDVKQTFPDGRTVYFYADTSTTHTRLTDGTEIIRFGTGQVEKHYVSGAKTVKFIDGTVKTIAADGFEDTVYPDSTRETLSTTGDRCIWHPGGHREVIKSDGTRERIYFDQSVKLLSNHII